jgi:ketosteroid isomerase-like protein
MGARDREGARLRTVIGRGRATFVTALREGDAVAACSRYTEDAWLLAPSSALLRGREDVEAFWRAGVGAGISELEFDVAELEHADPLAYEIGRYSLGVRLDDEGSLLERGKYLVVYRLDPDDEWRRAAEMFSPDEPPRKAVGATERRRSRARKAVVVEGEPAGPKEER